MATKTKWEIIAERKREKKQQRAREAGGVGRESEDWKVFMDCHVCGFRCCVNNNAEREVRPAMFAKMVVCPWCNPKSVRGEQRRVRARTCNTIALVRMLVDEKDKSNRKKIIAKLRSIHEDPAGG